MTPAPPAAWLRLALSWFALSILLGPAAVTAVTVFAGSLAHPAELFADPGQWFGRAMGSFFFLSWTSYIIAVTFFALPYLPLLILWARLASRMGSLETSRSGVLTSTLILAAPAAVVAGIAYGAMSPPFGFRGWSLVAFASFILFAIALSLALPRLFVPSLRAGAFAQHLARVQT